MVDGHERERRIDRRVDHLDVESVDPVDRFPVADRRTAERIDAELQACRADRFHVDRARECAHVGETQVLCPRRRRAPRRLEGDPLHVAQARSEDLVRAVLYPTGHVGIGRPPGRRVVLEAPVLGRGVGGRHDDAVGAAGGAAVVVGEDGARDHRRRREAVALLDDRRDVVRREHLERGALRRTGERMRVLAEEERPVGSRRRAELADRLGDREDVVLVERPACGRTAVSAGTERDALRRVFEVGAALEVVAFEMRRVDQQFPGRRLSGERRVRHRFSPRPRA